MCKVLVLPPSTGWSPFTPFSNPRILHVRTTPTQFGIDGKGAVRRVLTATLDDAVPSLLWSVAECTIGIVCVSIPPIKQLFTRLLSGFSKNRHHPIPLIRRDAFDSMATIVCASAETESTTKMPSTINLSHSLINPAHLKSSEGKDKVTVGDEIVSKPLSPSTYSLPTTPRDHQIRDSTYSLPESPRDYLVRHSAIWD
jgi:hypothetical protein